MLALWASVAACGSAPASEAAKAALPDSTAAATSTTAMEPTATPPAAPRYDVRGIFDPGMGGIIAFAIKLPHGWALQQSFGRSWINAYPTVELYTNISSPGGHMVIENLPDMAYTYDGSPMGQRLAQQMEQATGKPSGMLAPMLPVPYLKQVLLPLLAQKANLHPRIVAEHQEPVKQLPAQAPGMPGMQQATGYLDCVLAAGRKMRIRTTLTVVDAPQGTQFVSWHADNALLQTDGDMAAVEAQQRAILKTVVTNPTWARQNQELQDRGMQANTEQGMAALRQLQAQQKINNEQFQQRMANQQQQFAQHHANWMAQQHANDQSSQAFRDYLGGQTLYQNAETGQRTRVDNTYNHVYQDGQGHTLATNAPLSAGNVNWQELQQVELKNY